MPAYLFVEIKVLDAIAYQEYRNAVSATIFAYGGKYLVRGGKTEILDGDWEPGRVVILEFPSVEALKSWYESPEYKPLIALRERAAKSRLVIFEGI